MRKFFPGGHPADNQFVYQIVSDDAVVGALWIGSFTSERPNEWWVWEIEIDEEHRGKGHGRAAMMLAEGIAREHGAIKIGLNVFGHNTAAQNLYVSLGFTTTAVNMSKQL
jgi:ribosomal protein S18 acetylase RimI-like enzyme